MADRAVILIFFSDPKTRLPEEEIIWVIITYTLGIDRVVASYVLKLINVN